MKKLISFIFSLYCFSTYSQEHRSNNKTVLTKFTSTYSFTDFKVRIEKTKANLDLKSHILGSRFKTVIKEGYAQEKAPFAGHYTFIQWGCGSPCQMAVIVDKRTGKIYEAPSASLGYSYQKDSRMLIINPPDSLGFFPKDCVYCTPEVYVLNEQTKKFKRLIQSITRDQ